MAQDFGITDFTEKVLPIRLQKSQTAPTAVAGANAGTSPPVPVVAATATDDSGTLTFGTGTSPAAVAQVAVTFGTPFASAPRFVGIVATNTAAAGLGILYATSVTATGFTLNCVTAPAASQANTIYGAAYRVNV